jgi:hypothetical protein
VSTKLVGHGHDDLDPPLQPRRFVRTLTAFTPTRIFFIIQIFSNMRSCLNIAVLALAASILSSALSAPLLYGNLLVESKGRLPDEWNSSRSRDSPVPFKNSQHDDLIEAAGLNRTPDSKSESAHAPDPAHAHEPEPQQLQPEPQQPQPEPQQPQPEPQQPQPEPQQPQPEPQQPEPDSAKKDKSTSDGKEALKLFASTLTLGAAVEAAHDGFDKLTKTNSTSKRRANVELAERALGDPDLDK